MTNEMPLSFAIHLGEVRAVKHYKSDKPYRIINLACHTESGEVLVIYSHGEGWEKWARPLTMFDDMVELNGVEVPRFIEYEEAAA
jgi:hypothetical protein